MEIKVFGSGCSRCHKTLEVVNKVVSENHVDANVEYVTDLMKIMEYNVVSMPAIVLSLRNSPHIIMRRTAASLSSPL